MRQPFVDAPVPLLQIQGRKRWTINLLQSKQNITHFSLGMADDAAIRLAAIQASPELHPHRRLPDRRHLSGEWTPLARRSLSRVRGDTKDMPERGDRLILSRKSDAAWRDHEHRHRSGTRRHTGPTGHRANICVRSSGPANRLPRPPGAGFPAPLPEDHFWEPSPPAPGIAALPPFRPGAP